MCAGESGGNGENGANGLRGIGDIPGHTIGELAGNGEHRVGGANPTNGSPDLIKASCAPITLFAPSSSLSSNSIAIGIFGIILLLYITGGLFPDAPEEGAAGTLKSNNALGPALSFGIEA